MSARSGALGQRARKRLFVCGNGVEERGEKPSSRGLERVPIKWNHLIDKDAAQNQRVGACHHETSDLSDV
jgi:hypothetical protein